MARMTKKAALEALLEPSPQEQRVLKLISWKKTNTEIATMLGVHVQTVKNHVRSLFLKFRVVSRKDLLTEARKRKYV